MAYIANSVHGLTLGDLVLVENGADKLYTHGPSGETYTFGVLDGDTAWGNPRPVTESLLSMMTNGSQVVHVRDENREPSISVTIEASGASALAAAETALVAACGKPTTLTWQPPAWASVPTVFDVVWSELQHEMDSFSERYMRRSYSIKLQALPHARSATEIVTPAVTAVTPTVVDPGTSATNWTAPRPTGAAVTVVSGAVRSTYDPDVLGSSYYGTDLRRTFPTALDVSVNKFVAVDWKTSLAVVHGLIAVNGVPFADLTEVRREPAPTSGFTRSWYRFSDATTSVTQFNFSVIHPANAAATATLDIDQVLLANALPSSGTTRQKLMSLVPGGSVKTQGTIHVSHPTAALGRALIFTYPTDSGYSPSLRPWLSSSDGPTADTTVTVSGAYHPLTGVTRFNIPITAIPRGDTHLWARIGTSSGTGAVKIFSTARSLVGGVVVGDPQFSVTTVNFATVGDWLMVPIGRFALPTAQVGPAGFVYIDMQRDAAASQTVMLDDAYLFSMDEGRLTVVDCGTAAPSAGGTANHLWITAPSVTDPAGRVAIGTKADQSDAYWPPAASVKPSQVHDFAPEGTNVFVVTPNASDAATELRHYRRHHTHADS